LWGERARRFCSKKCAYGGKKGVKLSEEHKKKMSIAMMGNTCAAGNKGKIVSDEAIKYYPDSGRFLKQKPNKEKPAWLEIEGKTSFKNT
jgi:hypothetical protein